MIFPSRGLWQRHKCRYPYQRYQQSLDRAVQQHLLDLQRLQQNPLLVHGAHSQQQSVPSYVLRSIQRERENKTLTAGFADYGNVGIDSGLATDGFSEGDEDGLLVWNNTDMANEGSWFAFCPTLIPGHESAGLQDRVYWQSNEAPAEGTENCTTIVLHGAFE